MQTATFSQAAAMHPRHRHGALKIARFLCLMALAALGFAGTTARADESKIPEPFRGAATGSPFTINYNDWSSILHATVLDAGRSDRSAAPQARAKLGTRMVLGSTSSLRNEGNRILFAAFGSSPENKAQMHKLRTEIEAIPSQIPMKEWTKNEQLAYWLNLYNMTVIEQIANEYPVRSLKKLKFGKHSMWDQKLLKVAGVPLSLNDIHDILVNKWNSSIVMYGLFQGYVGGPNVLREAYTADNVRTLLIDNAKEFVNSNRGMRAEGDTLVISEYYNENKALFPNWTKDLKDHFMHLADPEYRGLVQATKKIRAKTSDFYIADLGGGMKSVAQADNTNTAALNAAQVSSNSDMPGGLAGSFDGGIGNFTMEGFASFHTMSLNELRFPPAAVEYIRHVQKTKSDQKGDVEVEEVFDKEAPKKQPK